MVLWKLLHYAANAFALTYRCQAPSHRCLARILISGGVPEYPKGISSGGTLCHRQGTSSRHCSLSNRRSTPRKLMPERAFSSTGSPPLRAYCAPEVVRSNAVGSPLGGRPGGGAQQRRRKSSWGLNCGGIPAVRKKYVSFYHDFKIDARGNTTQFGKRIQPEIFCRKKTGFRRNTLCISRKPDAFPVEKIGCSPQPCCVVLPHKRRRL